jgi:hypothetical protein
MIGRCNYHYNHPKYGIIRKGYEKELLTMSPTDQGKEIDDKPSDGVNRSITITYVRV